MVFHFYAVDTQMYMPFKNNDGTALDSLITILIEVKTWLSSIFFKLRVILSLSVMVPRGVAH